MDVQAVRLGLKTAAEAACERGFDYVPEDLSPPAFVVADMRGQYHQAFGSTGGLTSVVVACHVLTSHATDRTGQRAAMAYLANGQMLVALEADQTLGGVCSTVTVTDFDGPRQLTVGANDYWGVSFNVTVRG